MGESYLCHVKWALSSRPPWGGEALLLGGMVHVSLLCCHNREGGKLISPGLSRKILRFVLGWEESSSMRQSRLRSPFVWQAELSHTLPRLFFFSSAGDVPVTLVSRLICCLTQSVETLNSCSTKYGKCLCAHVLVCPIVFQIWAHQRGSASLMSLTHLPPFTGSFQKPGWTATGWLMFRLMEVCPLWSNASSL